VIGTAVVVRLRRAVTGEDRNHDPIYETTRKRLRGAAAAPRSSTDMRNGGRDGAITGLTVYLPPFTDVRADDAIEVDGVTYEIDGVPGVWTNPHTGHRAGVEVPLRRADG
jgi:hypothetical protein